MSSRRRRRRMNARPRILMVGTALGGRGGVTAVVGRQERIVTLPDGRVVARLDRVFQGFDARLVEGQVLYHGAGRFTLRVVAGDAFTTVDEAALCDAFLLRVPGVQVAVARVAAIARGPNGKFEFIAVEE